MITTKQGAAAAGRMAPAAGRTAPTRSARPASSSSTRTCSSATACRRPAIAIGAAASRPSGQFALTDKWTWGWDGTLLTGQDLLPGLRPAAEHRSPPTCCGRRPTTRCRSSISPAAATAATSTCARIYFYGFSAADDQKQIPVVHPVIDYDYVFEQSDPRRRTELPQQSDQPLARHREFRSDLAGRRQRRPVRCRRPPIRPSRTPTNCLLRGVPGTYTRVSAEATWKRTFIDPYGQMFTPFVSVRGDVAAMKIDNQPGVSNYIDAGRKQRRARHADGRPRIPLSVHQRAVLGHADDRADRAADRASERDQHRQAAERRCAEPDLRRQQSVQGQQVLRLGPRRRRRPRQCRRPVHRAVQPRRLRQRRCSASPISCSAELVRGRRPDQYRPATAASTPTAPTTSRASSYQPNSTFTFTSRFRFDEDDFTLQRTELETTASFDRWTTSRDVRQLRRPAGARLPRSTAKASSASARVQARRKLAAPRRRPLRPAGATSSARPSSASAISTIASSWP